MGWAPEIEQNLVCALFHLFKQAEEMPLLTRKRSSVRSTTASVVSSPSNTQKADVQETDYKTLLSSSQISFANGRTREWQ